MRARFECLGVSRRHWHVAKCLLATMLVLASALASGTLVPSGSLVADEDPLPAAPDQGASPEVESGVYMSCEPQNDALVLDDTLLFGHPVVFDLRIVGKRLDVMSSTIGPYRLQDLIDGTAGEDGSLLLVEPQEEGEPQEDGESQEGEDSQEGSDSQTNDDPRQDEDAPEEDVLQEEDDSQENEDEIVVYEGSIRLGEGIYDVATLGRVLDEDGSVARVTLTYAGQHIRTLVIDATAPHVEVRGVGDGLSTNESVEIRIKVSDLSWGYAAMARGTAEFAKLSCEGDEVASLPVTWDEARAGDQSHEYVLEVHADSDHGNDGTYVLRVQATDACGNASNVTAIAFTIDTTPPRLDVEFVGEESTPNGESLFARERAARVRVSERSFDETLLNAKNSPIRVSVRTWDGEAGIEASVGMWRKEGEDVYACEVTFPANASYELHVDGADGTGNVLEGVEGTLVKNGTYESGVFTIDDEPPHVEITYGTGVPKPRTHAGTDYFNKPVRVRVAVRDRNPDLASMLVTDAHGQERMPDWDVSNRDGSGYITCTATLTYAEEGLAVKQPMVRAVDRMGNSSAESMDPFVVDQTPPAVFRVRLSASPQAAERLRGSVAHVIFFGSKVGGTPQLQFDIADAHALDAAWMDDPAGVYARRWSELRGMRSAMLNLALREPVAESLGAGADFGRGTKLYVRDLAGNVCVWDLATGTAVEGESAHPEALVFDATAPRVEVTGAQAGVYYSEPVTIAIDVEERNMPYLQRIDPEHAVATIYRSEDPDGQSLARLVVSAGQMQGKESWYEVQEVLDADGHYTIDAGFEDCAGNRSNSVRVAQFTVDATPPVLSVEWDREGMDNGGYYREARTAVVVVQEHNFDESLVAIETTGAVGPWEHTGDTHACRVSFVSDSTETAPHTLVASARDLAGNQAKPYEATPFVLDTTVPTVTFCKRSAEGIGEPMGDEASVLCDRSAFPAALEPQVLLHDDKFLDASTVEAHLVGKRSGEELPARIRVLSDCDVLVYWDDIGATEQEGELAYDMTADDVYVLSAQASDKAGNASQRAEVTFSVNRFGSNFFLERLGELDADQAQESGEPLLLEPPYIEVHEVNVSGLAAESKDGESAQMVTKEHARSTQRIPLSNDEDGAGYSLSSTTSASDLNPYEGWTECVYSIWPGNFGEGSSSDNGDGGQGEYRVNIASRDQANHHNTTASYWDSSKERDGKAQPKDASVTFVLDEQGPQIEDLDLPIGFVWAREYQATFYLHDEVTEGDEVEVLVDGEPVEVRSVETGEPIGDEGLVQGEGELSFVVPAKVAFLPRSIDIRVGDYTGMEERIVRARGDGFCITTLALEGSALVALFLSVIVAARLWIGGRRRGASGRERT